MDPDTPPPIRWLDLERALNGTGDPDTLDEPTRAEYDRIRALPAEPESEPSEAESAARQFFADIKQYRAEMVADLEAQGIDPNSPESHSYFEQMARLRGERVR